MMRGKIIKKRTKNRETLLRNLRKGKARLEPRCQYETIPMPVKYSSMPQIHHLYADLIFMEYDNTLTIDSTLFNAVKHYKDAQVSDISNQKVVRAFLENKYGAPLNCELIADKFEGTEFKEWVEPIRKYCQRYEQLRQKLKAKQDEKSSEILHSYNQMNDKTEKTRQNLFKTYPCFELKSQLRDGHIQMTEFVFNEKYLSEHGYSMDSFIDHLLREGMPMTIPFEGASGQKFVKMRLENYLIDTEGFQSNETETQFIVKGGYIKKVKYRHHYYPTFEKGIPGFSIFATIVAKQKPVLDFSKSQRLKPNKDFIEFMAQKEELSSSFLSTYYEEKAEQIYTNMDKICQIREIRNQEEF